MDLCLILFSTLWLQELLKYSKGCDGCDDLQAALSSILGILKAVNDSMHLIAITGYEVREKCTVEPIVTNMLMLRWLDWA